MRLLVTGGLPLADGIVGLGGEIAWPNRLALGTSCMWRARSRKSVPRSNPDRAIVKMRSTMLNQNQEAVYVLTAKLLVSRRPAA